MWVGEGTAAHPTNERPAQRHSHFAVYRINNPGSPMNEISMAMQQHVTTPAIIMLYEGHCEREMLSAHMDSGNRDVSLLQIAPKIATAIHYVQDYSTYKYFEMKWDKKLWRINVHTFPRDEILDNDTRIYTHTRKQAIGFLTRVSIHRFDAGSFRGRIRVIIFDGVQCNSEILAIFSGSTRETVDTKSLDVRVVLLLTGKGMVSDIAIGFTQITGKPSTPNYVPQLGVTLDITGISFRYTQTYVSSDRTEPEYSVFVIRTPEMYQRKAKELYIRQNGVSIGSIRIYEGMCWREIKKCYFGERCRIEQPIPQIATIELYHDDPKVERDFTFLVQEPMTTTTRGSTTTTQTDSLTTISRSSSGMDQENIIWMSIVAVLGTLGR